MSKGTYSYQRVHLAKGGGSRRYKAALCNVGFLRGMSGKQSNRYVPAETLKAAVDGKKFDELAVFVDHAGFFEYPKVERLVAVTSESYYDEESQAVVATVEFYKRELADAMVEIFDSMLESGNTPDVGFSLVFWGAYGEREEPDDPLVLTEISHIESADIVFEPAAAGARVLEALSIQASNLSNDANVDSCLRSPLKPCGDRPTGTTNRIKEILPMEEKVKYEVGSTSDEAEPTQETRPTPKENYGARMEEIMGAVNARIDAAVERFTQVVDERLTNKAESEAIDIGGTPPRSPNIVMGLNGFEELEAAARALLTKQNAPKGVRPLSGIRELYLLLSGDYEMTGMFRSERVQFAAVDSSTLANLFADALNKAVIELGNLFPKWWEPAVTVENFNTLHDAKWIVMGGVGELPTVAEGSVYTEMSLDDQQESDSFVKKGGYLGITLEAIDKDDTRRIQAIPRALARAAWLTLGKDISYIFTQSSGLGPTMSDSIALFNASHSNLGSTALSFTSWEATRALMMAQTEVNSGEYLGAMNTPYLLWVPAELEFVALQILGSLLEPGTANNDVNPEALDEGQRARLQAARSRVIVPPMWTDANNWMAQANPMLYPGIGVGYRFGENPEVFSVSDPRAGLMFTNDVMPVKVRYFYAVGPIDYRPFYKHNVA